MRLNRYNWQDGDGTLFCEPAGLPRGRPLQDEQVVPFWNSGSTRATRLEQAGRSVVMIGGFTGQEIPVHVKEGGMPEWLYDADEYRVMLANPYSEELKREIYYRSSQPRQLAERMHREILEAIAVLRQLSGQGRQLQLRFYNGVSGLSQWMFDTLDTVAAVREWPQRFELAWRDFRTGWLEPDSGELVFTTASGKVCRRLNLSQPPRLPYFDDEGALVISF